MRLAAAAAALAAAAVWHSPQASGRYEFTSRQMGTEARIVLFAAGEAAARDAAAKAFARIAALDAVMSDYRDDSELMALCRLAGSGPVRVSGDLFRVLDASQRLAQESGGAFDVTAAPLIHLWRRARRIGQLPDRTDLAAAQALTGFAMMTLDARERTVALRERQMQLDLGGIGKGFAADEAAAVLKDLGYPNSLVALGGDVVASGAPPGAPGWTVDVETLSRAEQGTPRVLLRDAAVSTSGDAEQWVEIGGVRYSHILDPRTGQPITGRSSVTVVAGNATTSDMLATAVDVLGPEAGRRLVDGWAGASALIGVRDGTAGDHWVTSRRFP